MIAYFDTSAFVSMLLDEPTSEQAVTLWNAATRSLSARVTYAEARAAFAQAWRAGRISRPVLRTVAVRVAALLDDVDHIEIDRGLVDVAGDLAEEYRLRGYDAVHLAAALTAADPDLVVVTGDAALAEAARQAGLAVAHLAA